MPKVEGYIKRKSMLYKTGVEYGDYTLNFVQGCAHGCRYPCYAFLLKKRFGQIKTYEDWLKPYLVSNTLEILDKEIPRLKDKIKSVQLCFTTDPFMVGYSEIEKMSLDVIKKLNDAGIKCTVLTKGILPISLAKCSKDNEYGITLISLNEEYRERMEPGSAPYADRLKALKKLHEKYPTVLTDFRGSGMLICMEFPTDEIGHEVTKALFARNVMTAGTLVNAQTVRIEPPLVQADETIEKVLGALDEALAEVKAAFKL